MLIYENYVLNYHHCVKAIYAGPTLVLTLACVTSKLCNVHEHCIF